MILSPSLMCADLVQLGCEVEALDAAGADVFHLDIMDGEFVPNFALSWGDVAAVRRMTNKEIDVHLMVRNPGPHLHHALKNNVDIVYVHAEVGGSEELLREIRGNGMQAGLAVNPTTDVAALRHLLPLLDRVLVMRVHPGFAGQRAVSEGDDNLARLLAMKEVVPRNPVITRAAWDRVMALELGTTLKETLPFERMVDNSFAEKATAAYGLKA